MTISNYEMMGAIGQGQYGTAYKARNKLDGQLYCIKRIPMSARDDHTEALREAQLLSSLDHPNIIGYKESFVEPGDGSLCIVTSFCEEGDLFNKIRKKAAAKQYFSEAEVMDAFLQIASAIHYIHSKKILHRDLKTQNIFLCKGGIVKLGDFGISKVLEKTDQFATTVTGTPYYMAPEICTSQPYTYKSDIWSLGCVLYELCTLKHAFAADSLLSLVYQIVRGTFPPIPTDNFSKGLSDLVNSLLVRDANSRPSLGVVFKMPYVMQHMTRFKNEQTKVQERQLNKQANGSARRRQLLEVGAAAAPGAGNGEALTPKQRLEKKKDDDRRKRELELKVAALNMNKDRDIAAARKKEMVYTSNIGLSQQQQGPARAGTAQTPPGRGAGRAGNSIWDVDGAEPQPSTRGRLGALDDDDMPNMGTVGSMAAVTIQRPGPTGPAARAAQQARPGTVGPLSQGRRNNNNPWSSTDEDDVLMGSVVGGAQGGLWAGPLAPVDPYGATARAPASAQARAQGALVVSNLDDDMPNMGTVQMTHGRGMPMCNSGLGDSVLMGSVVLGGGTRGHGGAAALPTATSRGAGPVSSSTPTKAGVRPVSAPLRAPNANGPIQPGAVRFGVGADERASSPFAQPKAGDAGMDKSKIKFGLSSESKPRGAFDYAIKGGQGAAAASKPARGKAHAEDHYEDDFEDEYEDDFEDDDEAAQAVVQRKRILQNVADMASFDDESKGSIALVKERPSHNAVGGKARALKERCKAALGQRFEPVYAYLKGVRSAPAASVDEKEVQRKLLDIVKDKACLQNCFLVDQLVFTETMFS